MSNWELLKSTMEPRQKRPAESPGRKSASAGALNGNKKRKLKGPEKSSAVSALSSKSSVGTAAAAAAVTTSPAASLVPTAVSAVPPHETLLVVAKKSSKIGKYLALDCEMIGTNAPPFGPREQSTLARISITNYHGHVIYDSYVAPPPGHRITDYRTWVSGITAHHLARAPSFEHVQTHVRELLKGRILVGHALVNDFRALQFTHPKHMVRDTSTFPKFKAYGVGRTPGLKKVALMELGIDIQGAEHSSVEDARACMALYRKYKTDFELRASQRVLGQ